MIGVTTPSCATTNVNTKYATSPVTERPPIGMRQQFQHTKKFIEENVRIKNAIAAAVPTQEKFIEENVCIKNAIAAKVPTQEKFIEENVRIKNVIAAAVTTQKKFIEENVHIEVQKNIYQQFQQTRLPFNRHSRTPGSWTPGHGRLSTSRREKNKKHDVWSVLILVKL
ncbi:hypothetical protein TNCV_4889691 [Trichonephila clavipes]|nr:hypothetical protein TNCV_4889691 [Trichonephila clavipes]